MCYVNLHILETVIISQHCSHTLLSETQITQKYFTQVKSSWRGKKEMLDDFAINSFIYNFYKNLMTNSLKAGQPRDDYDLNKLIVRGVKIKLNNKNVFFEILEIFDKISQILD